MSKINMLDKSVYNRIAAGEVVERPSSIVKECVENALDAGATSISIEIVSGGIKKITISDNGEGIEFEDLKKVFYPHATSKIKKIDDLDNIGSLGFRGEALASIGSVSQVQLLSKHKDSDVGGEILVNGGEIEEPVQKGCSQGTTICVKNLFYNVPARAKFLKGYKTEEGYITNMVSRFILAHPEITFKYIADGETIYQTIGKTLKDAIYVVYGKETTNALLPVNYKNGDMEIMGYITKPVYAKPNKTYQTLVINGRYVVNSTVSAAVYAAFENYLMKGKFPFFVLHLNMPFDKLDVNVHPNKLDVKFENSNSIYGSFSNAVARTLMEANNIIQLEEPIMEQKVATPIVLPSGSGMSFESKFNNKIESFKEIKTIIPTETKTTPIITARQDTSMFSSIFSANKEENKPMHSTMQTMVAEVEETPSYKLIGTLFNTYIIVEWKDMAYIIDQHAAHERLLFEKLKEKQKGDNCIQDLLLPYVFKVNSTEKVFIDESLQTFKELGFTIVEFGNLTYKVTTVPLILQGINLEDFINDCLKDLKVLSKNIKELEKLLATKACKAAVKGGQTLNKLEIDTLMKQITTTKTPLLCPHGRPIVVELKITEIEKWFKRIV